MTEEKGSYKKTRLRDEKGLFATTITTSTESIMQLDKLALENRRSRNQEMRFALEYYIAAMAKAKKNQEKEEE